MRRFIAIITVLGAVIIPSVVLADSAGSSKTPAPAAKVVKQDPRLKRAYTDSYYATKKKCGSKCVGRNIRKYGVAFTWVSKDKERFRRGVRPATNKELARSKRQLDRLRLSHLVPALPRQEPAGVMSAVTPSPTPLARCIIAHESGGNTQAVNGQYRGIAQWSQYVWTRDGGLKYSYDPRGATFSQQLEVLERGLRNHGCSDWCPFDGC